MICDLLENRSQSTTPSNAPPWLLEAWGGGTKSASGVTVTAKSALKFTPYWAAVNIIAGAVGALPLVTYKRLARGKERAATHRVYGLLHDRPNEYMDALTFRELLQAHVLTHGNGYAEIQRDEADRPVALWPLLPDRTSAKLTPRTPGKPRRLYYEVTTPEGKMDTLPWEDVLHIKGLGFDGLSGYSPVRYHIEAIGLGKAAEEYAGRFFGQGVTRGAFEHPGTLGKEGRENLAESIQRERTGLKQAHRIWILEEGMKWRQTGIPATEAQLLESRKFSVTDVARIFQVPPHMLAELTRATFNNIEWQGMNFVTQTLYRWLKRWEGECNWKLFAGAERRQWFAEFLVEAFLRGDIKTRYGAYRTGKQWGWLSTNDIRERENLNPVPGGDVYLVPLNMVPADQAGKKAPKQLSAGRTDPKQVAAAFRGIVIKATGEMLRKELNDARRALGRGSKGFEAWVGKQYPGYERAMRLALGPALEGAAEAIWWALADRPPDAEILRQVGEQIKAAAERHLRRSKGSLLAQRDGAPGDLDWEAERARKFAEAELSGLVEMLKVIKEERHGRN